VTRLLLPGEHRPRGFERTLASAEKGYSDMLRYFSQAKNLTAEVEKELQSMFKQLRERLDGLQRLG
jgi:hypothetical protein